AKKAAKKATKKVAKKAAKKATKKVAKKTAKKDTSKKDSTTGLSREEAIAMYKEKHKDALDSQLADSLKEYELEDKLAVAEETKLETIEESEDSVGLEATENYSEPGPNLQEEYNPDDEQDEKDDMSFGWGYNDAFDSPEEEVSTDDLDEDERYALGLDKSDENEDEDDFY
ncbi:histone protein, partial [Halobacteriovorax sp. CON-3]